MRGFVRTVMNLGFENSSIFPDKLQSSTWERRAVHMEFHLTQWRSTGHLLHSKQRATSLPHHNCLLPLHIMTHFTPQCLNKMNIHFIWQANFLTLMRTEVQGLSRSTVCFSFKVPQNLTVPPCWSWTVHRETNASYNRKYGSFWQVLFRKITN
jgi:hypothetical protein